jgi:hypothetical protein
VNVLVAVGCPPVLEADGHVVEKAAGWLRDQPERSSDDNKKIKEEQQYILVLQYSCLGASLPASIVNHVSPLQHVDSLAAVKRCALSSRNKLLHCCVVSRCMRLHTYAVHCTPIYI